MKPHIRRPETTNQPGSPASEVNTWGDHKSKMPISTAAPTSSRRDATSSPRTHVQGVRLNHTIFAREEGLVMR